MARYANDGFEIIYDVDNNIKGINFGYSDISEHQNYYGEELEDLRVIKFISNIYRKNKKYSAFNEEKIKNSSSIRLFEGTDGRILLTNMLTGHEIVEQLRTGVVTNYQELSKEKIDNMINFVSNHPDKLNDNHMFDVSWGSYTFYIVSVDEQSKVILYNLYDSIKNGNVAVSSDFPTLFKNRGLSFINLDRLSAQDIKIKHYREYKKKIRNRKSR